MNLWRLLRLSRRWFQLRLRTAFAIATVLCAILAWPHLSRQWAYWQLCSYGDLTHSDLREVDKFLQPKTAEAERIERLLKRLLPAEERWGVVFFEDEPWIIRKLTGPSRLMVVIVRTTMQVPGSGDVRIVIFDCFGRIVTDRRISTENRMYARSAVFEPEVAGMPCIVVDCDYFWRGTSQRQYIAVRDTHIALVRMEWERTTGTEVVRSLKRSQFDFDYRFQSYAQWSEALNSQEQIAVLEALCCLPSREVVDTPLPADMLRLEALCQSEHAWTREAARVALESFRKRD